MDMKNRTRTRLLACVVVFVSFLIMTLCSGVLFGSCQTLHEPFGSYYDQPATSISWLGTTLVGSWGLSGLVAGPLAHRFGERGVVMAGSLMSSLGLVLSIFVPYYGLFITFGVMTGFGLGMMYLGALSAIQRHISRHRALALATALCGVGIGALAWTPLTMSLLRCYSLCGTFLILAALQLQGLWSGALLGLVLKSTKMSAQDSIVADETKSPEPLSGGQYELVKPPTYFTANFAAQDSTDTPEETSTVSPRLRSGKRPRPLSTSLLERHNLAMPDSPSKRASLDIDDLIKRLSVSTGIDTLSTAPELPTRKLTSQIDYSENSIGEPVSKEEFENRRAIQRATSNDSSIFIDFIESVNNANRNVNFEKSKVKRYTWSAFESDFNAMDYKDHYDVIEECPDMENFPGAVYRAKAITPEPQVTQSSSSSRKHVVASATGARLFTDKSYVLFISGCFLVAMGLFTPFLYSPAEAVFSDVVLVMFAVSGLLARLIAGAVGDRFAARRGWLCAASICVCGLFTVFLSLGDRLVSSVLYAAVIGIGAAFYVVLVICMLVDFWGAANVCLMTGHLLTCAGLATLIMQPFSHFLTQSFRSFSSDYVVYGCFQIMGGCAVLATTILKYRRLD